MATGADDDVVARAEQALADVGRDPRAALAAADTLLGEIPKPSTPQEIRAVATAQRAAGLALRETGDAASATTRLRIAVRSARRRGHGLIEAECLITLAFLESEAGRTTTALELLQQVPADLDDTVPLRVLTTRALALQRTGRHDESLREYQRAIDLAASLGDPVRRARLLNNRAMALAYTGRTVQAVDDLQTAAALYGQAGATALSAHALANAAWVIGMAGDVPGALALFDRSEQLAPDAEHAEMWSDRAEIYLRAGLARDALRSATQAVEWLRGQGWGASEAEALLLLARCELEVGDDERAATHARSALSMMRRQGRTAWTALARYVVVTSRTRRGLVASSEVIAVGDALRAAGWGLASVDVVVTAAAAAAAADRAAVARRLLAAVPRSRGAASELAGRLRLADGLRHELDGDHRLAQRALTQAFQRIEQRRALLGAADLRALSSTLAQDVVTAGLRVAETSGSVRDLFTWAERSRAAAFRYRPAVPVGDEGLQDCLTRLRWASRALEDARLAGRVDRAAAAEVARCEGEILRRSRRARGTEPRRALDLSALRTALRDTAFVHVVVHRGHVLSATLAGGALRQCDHGTLQEVERLTRRVAFSRARSSDAGRRDDGAVADLDRMLWGPLATTVGQRPVVVSAPPELGTVLWGCLPGFADRPLSLAPSAQAWLDARSREPRRSRVAAVSGPDLPSASTEVEKVLAQHGARPTSRGASTAAMTLASLGSADLVHVAAHGRLRTDNPLFSSLRMADGEVTGYDLEQLDAVPSLVVLSCCHAGSGAAVAPGEAMGLASTLLRLGARSVIAPAGTIPDEESVAVMTALHARLAVGDEPAEALASCRSGAWAAAATLVAFGA